LFSRLYSEAKAVPIMLSRWLFGCLASRSMVRVVRRSGHRFRGGCLNSCFSSLFNSVCACTACNLGLHDGVWTRRGTDHGEIRVVKRVSYIRHKSTRATGRNLKTSLLNTNVGDVSPSLPLSLYPSTFLSMVRSHAAACVKTPPSDHAISLQAASCSCNLWSRSAVPRQRVIDRSSCMPKAASDIMYCRARESLIMTLNVRQTCSCIRVT